MKALSAPIAVCLSITNKCNLSCKYCLASNTHSNNELPTEELLNIIKQFKELKIPQVLLFGGEPLVRKDFFVIVKSLNNAGIAPALTTNGTLITKAIAKKLSEFSIKLYKVSLDGSSAKTQDSVRGKGSFKKTREGIKNLLDRKCKVTLSTTISRFNYHDIRKIVLLAQEMGVSGVKLNRIMCVGSAGPNTQNLMLTVKERDKLFCEIKDLKTEFGSFITTVIPGDLNNPAGEDGSASKHGLPVQVPYCVGGVIKCMIRPDGWVTPCEMLWDVKAGNLKKEALYEIWHRSPVLKAFRKKITIQEKDIAQCRRCDYVWLCNSCRYRLCSDPSHIASSPFCWKNTLR